ncbi:MAG: excinuclease ABC subunit UvrA [Gemmatimonadaceae bacterium]|nr:excinuclease ABC subunit UvrA [Gemmatimonadaceae bacterium]NUO95429.1 excinuclease ABC subunit UvrA [Gemmatimonadaceae bacterium]NUP70130.1 excinuclease ABC subunit UvrA [Gemmatimonadaceae bacterium]NUS47685.1 excinuclease ABC subunit UvrA [Gemmatimonadaceae bacterium]
MAEDALIVRGAREHNLRNVDVTIPRDRLTVITGLSGSGKSSLAFDTIYAEGQRRYVESLSAYARQFLGLMEKPDVDAIEGLSPAISIEQKTAGHNPRSTVGTVTEIYDYLRLLYARAGTPHCPNCGRPVQRQSPAQIAETVLGWAPDTRIEVRAPLVQGRKGEFRELFESVRKQGFIRAYVDGALVEVADPPKLNRRQNHSISVVVDRLAVRADDRGRLTDSIETALKLAEGLVEVYNADTDEVSPYSEKYGCPVCGISMPELEPRHFSFNSPFGACTTCGGLGTRRRVSEELVLGDPRISILEGVVLPWGEPTGYLRKVVLPTLARQFHFDLNAPWGDLPQSVRDILLHGDGASAGHGGAKKKKSSPEGSWEGIIANVERRYEESDSDMVRMELEAYMLAVPCSECHGQRLKPESLAVTVHGMNIGAVTELAITESLDFFDRIPVRGEGRANGVDAEIAGPILKEVRERLRFLVDVGLDYLTLGRSAESLSGGEAQRIRLATQIGSRLVGVLYILDEPSIGLHQRDNSRLLATLEQLRDLGNTVIVVEHDEETMRAADYVIDMGPGAGKHGGEIIASGTVDEIVRNPRSITGKFLSGEAEISVPAHRRKPDEKKAIRIQNAREHNLRNVNAEIPLGLFVAVTGVSGSGKSTLIEDILHQSLARHFYRARVIPGAHDRITGLEHIDKVIDIDQSPIGRTPRSNPATYTGLFTPIRELFAELPEAKIRGYGPGRFSFNVKGGRCEACQGDGLVKIEMHFLPDVYVPCEVCKGKRYNRETLEVRFRGQSIADVLDMTVEDALTFFENQPRVRQKLETLNDVGLGYIHLGQSATTLSGGEAQRIKLATELSKRDTGRTFYILDEPTTGLHFEDVRVLLHVLHRLVDRGNTVLVIEHNLDVIKTADWIIDLGPEGGTRGGTIVASGTPEDVVRVEASHTGRYLKPMLKPTPARQRKVG